MSKKNDIQISLTLPLSKWLALAETEDRRYTNHCYVEKALAKAISETPITPEIYSTLGRCGIVLENIDVLNFDYYAPLLASEELSNAKVRAYLEKLAMQWKGPLPKTMVDAILEATRKIPTSLPHDMYDQLMIAEIENDKGYERLLRKYMKMKLRPAVRQVLAKYLAPSIKEANGLRRYVAANLELSALESLLNVRSSKGTDKKKKQSKKLKKATKDFDALVAA